MSRPRLPLALAALLLASCGAAWAASGEAVFPSTFSRAPALSIDVPAGTASATLPADVGAAYLAAAHVQAWRTQAHSRSSALLGVETQPDAPLDRAGAPATLLHLPLRDAAAGTETWFVSVAAPHPGAGVVELLVGRDLNGDGLPQANELLCRPVAAAYATPRCLLDLRGLTDRPLWAFARLLGPASDGQAKYMETVTLQIDTAAFAVGSDGRVDVAAPADFQIERQGSATPVTVAVGFHTSPGDAPAAQAAVGGLLLTGADHALAGATVYPWRLDLSPIAHPGQPYALAARYDADDEVEVPLAAGESNRYVSIDHPGADDILHLSLLGGGGVSVIGWNEGFPAASVDSRGSAATPPPGKTVFVLDPGAFPGAPNHIDVCAGCSGADLPLAAGRIRLVVHNPGRAATTVRLKARIHPVVDFATRQPPGLYAPSGNYYNPQRPGDGVFLERVGALQLIHWYTFDAAGDPIWYTASLTPDYASGVVGSVNAVLYRVDQNADGAHRMTAQGRLVLTRAGDDLMFGWNLGDDFGTNRLSLAAQDGCAQVGTRTLALSGHWYSPDAPGWGINLLGLGPNTAAGLYTYDAAGAPRWLFGTFASTDQGYAGSLFQQQGSCPTCAYAVHVAAPPVVGSARFDFSDDGTAHFTAQASFVGALHGDFHSEGEAIVRATDRNACPL